MVAELKKSQGIVVVSISGTLDIEHTQGFKQACLQKLSSQKLVFNMSKASFVGSTGLQSFIETVKGLCDQGQGLKLVNPGLEFRRVFQNLEIQNLEIHDTEETAINSFKSAQII